MRNPGYNRERKFISWKKMVRFRVLICCNLDCIVFTGMMQDLPLFYNVCSRCHGGSCFGIVAHEEWYSSHESWLVVDECGYRQEPHETLLDLVQRFGKITDCDLCEWECFRDPSDLLGPFADALRQPFQLVGKIFKEPRFFQLLLEDLRYYKACNYFNGRLAP